jgi:hypothetical protein
MRDNSHDRTIERNHLQKWRFLIADCELGHADLHQLPRDMSLSAPDRTFHVAFHVACLIDSCPRLA